MLVGKPVLFVTGFRFEGVCAKIARDRPQQLLFPFVSPQQKIDI